MKASHAIIIGLMGALFIAATEAKSQTFTRFTTSDGLINNIVLSICEDREFNFWFGTVEGLGRWLPRTNEWQKFTPYNSPLIHYQVNAILQDANGYLWFGSDNGINLFRNDRWESYSHDQMPAYLRARKITCLFLDSRHQIWIGTKGGGITKCFRNRLGDLEWIPYDTGNSKIVSDEISAINEDASGNIWIGSMHAGVCKFDGLSQWIGFPEQLGFLGDKIHVIFRDQNNILWFGTNRGIFKKEDDSSWELVAAVPNVLSIAEDRSGNLWFGTQNHGLYRCASNGCEPVAISGLGDIPIRSMCRDHDGNLWLTTEGAGCFRLLLNWYSFNPNNSGLVDPVITDIVETADGTLWIATASSGLARFDGVKFDTMKVNGSFYGANAVHRILMDRNNWLWCATEYGVHGFDGKSHHWISYVDSLPSKFVCDILQDRSGRYWFATRGGLSCYDGVIWRTYDYRFVLSDAIITTIFEDHRGLIWFGTANAGVGVLADDSLIAVYDRANGLPSNLVSVIVQDENLVYWFGTDAGIARFDGAAWDYFTVENSGLVNNYVKCFLVDRNNNLWIGTRAGGLNRFDGQFWVDYSDQIEDNDVNRILQDSQGNYWICTSSGLLKYFPDKSRPQAFLTIAPKGIIGVGSALFYFSGRDVETPIERLLYSWRLRDDRAGSSGIWSDFHPQNYCELAFPTNSYYTFSVKSRDESGNESFPDSVCFIVDTAPPHAFIIHPSNNEIINGKVAVIGTAFDSLSIVKDFKCYWLSYAVGSRFQDVAENDWQPIATAATIPSHQNIFFARPVINDTLIIWDTAGLNGDYWLRLAAEDTLQHVSYYIIKVKVVAGQQTVLRERGGTMAVADRLTLYIPPGAIGTDQQIYCNPLEVAGDLIPPVQDIQVSSLAYVLAPTTLKLTKPATLSCSYRPEDILNLVESRLAFMYLDPNQEGIDLEHLSLKKIDHINEAAILGGGVDLERHCIETTIKQFGVYVLIQDNRSISGSARLIDIDCQPRIFSPQGTSYAMTATISFELTADSPMSIKIYNPAGRLVYTLMTRSQQRAGRNSIQWDGRDFNGNFCPSDLYLIVFESERELKTKTVVILNK